MCSGYCSFPPLLNARECFASLRRSSRRGISSSLLWGMTQVTAVPLPIPQHPFVHSHLTSVPNYRRWIREIEELQGVRLNMALLSDTDSRILKMVPSPSLPLLYPQHNLIHDLAVRMRSRPHSDEEALAGVAGRLSHRSRGADPVLHARRTIRRSATPHALLSTFVLMSAGRNWYEVLRQYDALMMSNYHPVVCGANWAQGGQVQSAEPHDHCSHRHACRCW